MRLKKIEIAGFKSFYEKIRIIFPQNSDHNPGITAIVGPNGSGKSNVCDALKWGLGAQSKKGFRSKKSRDVIFAGSSVKRPLSSASVYLSFDNSDKKIPLDYDKVVIGRKIYRDGENEYFINNGKAQLKDILHILGQAGIGQDSYSIINQGMADRMLLVNPLERRKIIEEAAKVKHFQLKKESSQKKLETSQINLEKARSIIKEIFPRLDELKEQAEKKIKQEEHLKELREKGELYLGGNFLKIKEKKKDLLKKEDNYNKQIKVLTQEIEKIKNIFCDLKKEDTTDDIIWKFRDKLNQLENKGNSLAKEIYILEGKNEILKEEERIKSLKKYRTADIPYIKNKLENLLKLIDSCLTAKDFSFSKLKEIRQGIADLKNEITQGIIEKRPLPEKTTTAPEIINNENKIQEFKKELEQINDQKKTLSETIAEKTRGDKEKKSDFYELEQKLEDFRQKKDYFSEKLNSNKIELAKIEMKENDLRQKARNILKEELENIPCPHDISRETIPSYGELEDLSRKIEICDSIDSEVVENYQAIKERWEFLSRESEDLKKTIRSLKKIIKKLEEKVERRFQNTFEKISKNFEKYFKIIFKGGFAKLTLVEIPFLNGQEKESSPKTFYQTGIDIKAVPPGKKINNIGMLSGGERALTSLALLFAIIGSSLPPFVLLDEVDAALDEANSARFARIIEEMAKKTQFIVITHNRQVMQKAQLLYGVTMQKDGVSKLLSVNLEQRDHLTSLMQ